MGIPERIKELKKTLNLTTLELAEKINLSPRTLGGYEREERKISVDLVEAMLKYLNVSPQWLITGEGSMFLGKDAIEKQNKANQEKKNEKDERQTLLKLNRIYKYLDKLILKHKFVFSKKIISEIAIFLFNFEDERFDAEKIDLESTEATFSTESEMKAWSLCNLITNIKEATNTNE